MAVEVERENLLFAASTTSAAGRIVGREDKARELVRALAGYKRGYAHPFVFVYGRTGSGKSVMVRLVCESLGLPCRFVNLRNAQTVFGCANLILSELRAGEAKAWKGTGGLVEMIAGAIEPLATKLFVLVLDEFDVLMSDRRGKPSDFVYRLLMVQERLREKGRLMTIVAISNNAMATDELDDRVRSRIGSSPEILFNSYTKEEILAILKERAAEIFDRQPGPSALRHCAELCSQNHGDVRRAIDLMNLAGEIAGASNCQKIAKDHIDMAVKQLEKDRVVDVMSSASYHLKAVLAALVRLTYNNGYEQENALWYSTSTLYQDYCRDLLDKHAMPVTYRRVSELLTELENDGLVTSRKSSLGRHGYGRLYRLAVHPEVAGRCC
jgi:cell division control protein 6